MLELLGDPRGCANGMGGSASIQSVPANIYGHDGMLGSQGPIAVGACYANRKPTLCFAGDAAAEEDYFLAALGWVATHKLPILFIVEDNNLSVLTEKRVRRSWDITDVAASFGLTVKDTTDDPEELYKAIPHTGQSLSRKSLWPALINIHTTRLRWHAGAGTDDPEAFDRHKNVSNSFDGFDVAIQTRHRCEDLVREAWITSLA